MRKVRKAPIFLCSFSGEAADLPKGQRTHRDILRVLAMHPRVSCFDLCEHAWLAHACEDITRAGLAVYDKDTDRYPWVRYVITEAGQAWLQQPAGTPLSKGNAS